MTQEQRLKGLPCLQNTSERREINDWDLAIFCGAEGSVPGIDNSGRG